MNIKHLSLVPALLILFLVVGSAQAAAVQDKWGEQTQKLKEKFKLDQNLPVDLTERTKTIKVRREKACLGVQEKVNVRWEKYSTHKLEKVSSYDKGIKILDKRVEFYKTKNFNDAELTKLTTDRAKLEGLITEYKSLYATFLLALRDAKTLPCANYEGNFLTELKEAKTAWSAVQVKATEIKAYYRNYVKPHMQELNAQVSDKVKETEGND